MKSKKINKKLALNKKTIANLRDLQMGKIQVGELAKETCLTICIQRTCPVQTNACWTCTACATACGSDPCC